MGTILIVEDDDDLRELFAEALRHDRHSVICARDGREALAVLENIHPCLVLLDLMMPVMSGGEVLEQLDRSNRLDELPVVVVSAVADQTTARGACRFMRKPVELSALLEVAREYCPGGLRDGRPC